MTVSGAAGKDAYPFASHQRVKERQSAAYARRVDADTDPSRVRFTRSASAAARAPPRAASAIAAGVGISVTVLPFVANGKFRAFSVGEDPLGSLPPITSLIGGSSP